MSAQTSMQAYDNGWNLMKLNISWSLEDKYTYNSVSKLNISEEVSGSAILQRGIFFTRIGSDRTRTMNESYMKR